jgi:hypothetical protein
VARGASTRAALRSAEQRVLYTAPTMSTRLAPRTRRFRSAAAMLMPPAHTVAGNMLRAGDTCAFNSLARMYTVEHALRAAPAPP